MNVSILHGIKTLAIGNTQISNFNYSWEKERPGVAYLFSSPENPNPSFKKPVNKFFRDGSPRIPMPLSLDPGSWAKDGSGLSR